MRQAAKCKRITDERSGKSVKEETGRLLDLREKALDSAQDASGGGRCSYAERRRATNGKLRV